MNMNRSERRKLLQDLLFGQEMPDSPPLAVLSVKEKTEGGIVIQEIKFNSAYYPEYRTANSGQVYANNSVEVIPGILLSPAKNGNGKGIVALHQHGSEFNLGKSEVAGLKIGKHGLGYNYGYQLAERGFTVLCFDFKPFEERQINHENNKEYWGERFDKQEATTDGLEPMGRHVLDTKRAVDVLQYYGITNIGIIGHSLGGLVTHYALALDERIKAGAANCGISTLQSIRDNHRVHTWAWTIKGFKQRFGEIHNLYELITAPIHISAGVKDQGFPISGVRQFVNWAGAGGGKITWYEFADGHCFPQEARAQAYHFLEDKL